MIIFSIEIIRQYSEVMPNCDDIRIVMIDRVFND